MRVLVEGSVDRTVLLFGYNADPGPELTWARGITLLSAGGATMPETAGPVAVVGYSTAGIEALAFAATHHDRVDRLVLVSVPMPDDDDDALGFSLTEVTAKALLLFGARDPLTGSRHGAWWQQRLPDARLEMIPGGGHELLVPLWKRVLSHTAPHCKRATK